MSKSPLERSFNPPRLMSVKTDLPRRYSKYSCTIIALHGDRSYHPNPLHGDRDLNLQSTSRSVSKLFQVKCDTYNDNVKLKCRVTNQKYCDRHSTGSEKKSVKCAFFYGTFINATGASNPYVNKNNNDERTATSKFCTVQNEK